MKRYLVIVFALALAFSAGAALSAVVINVTSLSRTQVCLEEAGAPCVPGADCDLMVTVSSTSTGDSGYAKSETLQFRSGNAAAWTGNNTQASNVFRKARRAQKKAVLNEDAE